jgi:hypothetical protein
MSRDLIVLLIRVFPVTLIFSASVGAVMLVKALLISTMKYFSAACDRIYICYWEAIAELAVNPITWKLLLLFWLIGVIITYAAVYKDLRTHR